MIKMNKLKLIAVLGFFATVHAGKFIKWFNGVQGYIKKKLILIGASVTKLNEISRILIPYTCT